MKTESENSVYIRWMVRKDMQAVLDIEGQCFDNPWTYDEFIRCLRQRNCIGMVAELEEQVVGFKIFELHKKRLYILDFAVHKDFRRKSVGRAMIGNLVKRLSHQRRNRILLEVREKNLAAQLFFRSVGFRAVSILRGFYDETTEDAYQFEYALAGSVGNEISLTSRFQLSPLRETRLP